MKRPIEIKKDSFDIITEESPMEDKLDRIISLLEDLLKIQFFGVEFQGCSALQLLSKDLPEIHAEVTELLNRKSFDRKK